MSWETQIPDFEKEIVEVTDIMRKYINKMDNVEIFENDFERELYNDLPELVRTETKTNTDEKYRQFKERLDGCKNKNDCDEIGSHFEELNNKKTRRVLARDLLEYRKEYHLVTPFMCRLAAIIYQNWRDMGEFVNEGVFADYEKLRENLNSSFVINDKKSRNLKYICEFTKFKLIDSQKTIACIQHLIDDLKGHNIELLIAALESVGRFLYLSTQSANKFTFLLSKLENIMKQKSFPLFTTSQLLNSINLLKPHIEAPRLSLPPKSHFQTQAEAALNRDIITDLDQMIDELIKIMQHKEGLIAVQKNIINCIQNYDFLRNYNYAYLISELNVPEVSNYVVKRTLEKLTESIQGANYQSCLLWSRFLGELFKYDLIKRNLLFVQLEEFFHMEGYPLGIINLVCTVLQTCDTYLESKKVSSRNQKFLLLVELKRFIHNCSYIPMLEEFKIIDIFDDLEPNLTVIKVDVLNKFMKENEDNKNLKEFDYSKALDLYLDKKNLKEIKVKQEPPTEDPRSSKNPPEQEPNQVEKNNQMVGIEFRQFQKEFSTVMNSHMKDLSGRIAKPAYVEKVIQKKKEKKKMGENERKIVIIGRNGNKFIKKDIIFEDHGKEIGQFKQTKNGKEESQSGKME